MFLSTVALALMTAVMTGINYSLLRANTDPHVLVYASHDQDRPSVIVLVIKNVGSAAAYDVGFTCSESLPARAFGFEPPKEPIASMETGPLVRGIPMLAPGETRVIAWGQYGGLHSQLQERSIEVVASFRAHGMLRRRRIEVQSYLDISSFAETDASEPPHVALAKETKRIADELGHIRRDLRVGAREQTPQERLAVVQELSRRLAGGTADKLFGPDAESKPPNNGLQGTDPRA